MCTVHATLWKYSILLQNSLRKVHASTKMEGFERRAHYQWESTQITENCIEEKSSEQIHRWNMVDAFIILWIAETILITRLLIFLIVQRLLKWKLKIVLYKLRAKFQARFFNRDQKRLTSKLHLLLHDLSGFIFHMSIYRSKLHKVLARYVLQLANLKLDTRNRLHTTPGKSSSTIFDFKLDAKLGYIQPQAICRCRLHHSSCKTVQYDK